MNSTWSSEISLEHSQLELDLLHSALEAAEFGIAITDRSGRVLLANETFAHLMGVQTTKLLGGLYLELFGAFATNPSFHKVFRLGEPECNTKIATGQNGANRNTLIKGADGGPDNKYRIVSAFDAAKFDAAGCSASETR